MNKTQLLKWQVHGTECTVYMIYTILNFLSVYGITLHPEIESMKFFLNGAELSLNSVNSGNLINY